MKNENFVPKIASSVIPRMKNPDYDSLLATQKAQATGMRLEMLEKQGQGERKLVSDILLPVLQSVEGLVLEKEMLTLGGAKAYIDAFFEPLDLAFDAEGYVVHAEMITRSRFDFERQRIRSMAVNGYRYVPFSWDEMDKKPEVCRRAVYELLGRLGKGRSQLYLELSVHEREVVRMALAMGKPFRIAEVSAYLQCTTVFSRKIIRKLIERGIVKPTKPIAVRHHEYVLVESARSYL